MEYDMPNPVLKNVESGDLIEVTKSPFVLGRGLFCDCTILNKVISRSHCRIEKSGLNWILTDLSTNGTMVNNKLYINNANTILKNDDEICLGYQAYTYKFLLESPRVSNNDQVNRLSAEQENTSPPSPNSFDENGVSDDVLNNIADNILFDGTEAIGPKNLAVVQDLRPIEVILRKPPYGEGQNIEIKPEEMFNLPKLQLYPELTAVSLEQSRTGEEIQVDLSKANFNNLAEQQHPLISETNTNLMASNNNYRNIFSNVIPSLPQNITNEAAIEISSDEEHMNDITEESSTIAPKSTYSQTIEDVNMKCCEQTDNAPSTSGLQMSSVDKPTVDPPSNYSQMQHDIVQKYANSTPSISSIRIVNPQNANKRLKFTPKTPTSLHEAGTSRVSPKISDITSIIKSEAALTVNQNQMQCVLSNPTTSATEVSPMIIQILSNGPEMWEQLNQKAANEKSREAETKLEKASTSKSLPKQQSTKQQDQNQFKEMENELMCAICANLFIKAVTLGCSHSFCLHCIQMWKKKKSDCPICRKKITSQNNTLVLDNLVEKMIDNASKEEKQQRKDTIEERNKIAKKEIEAKKKTVGRTSGRRGRRRASNRNNNNNNIVAPLVIQIPPVPVPAVLPIINLDELSSIDSEDSDYYNYADYDGNDWYDGVYENAYYGGYGRCYNCGNQGHWSNGCPYR
ncbi:uncharacterized protein [Euwallacea similis]|uniref:uncharacterized protein n=1 Tax=Euwallacea similis TaxID=1736056 RepID=UPI00344E76C1